MKKIFKATCIDDTRTGIEPGYRTVMQATRHNKSSAQYTKPGDIVIRIKTWPSIDCSSIVLDQKAAKRLVDFLTSKKTR